MTMETFFTNARIVTRNEVICGSLVIKNGRILAIDDTRLPGAKTVDLQGDLLLPGLSKFTPIIWKKIFCPGLVFYGHPFWLPP